MISLDALLQSARSDLRRLTPTEVATAWCEGALLVDIRPDSHRRDEGAIPGAVVVERNVLEWRFDPAGRHRIAEFVDAGQLVIIVCDEGYASSLAAATLQSLGLTRATDLVGGFRAWKALGLPVADAQPTAT